MGRASIDRRIRLLPGKAVVEGAGGHQGNRFAVGNADAALVVAVGVVVVLTVVEEDEAFPGMKHRRPGYGRRPRCRRARFGGVQVRPPSRERTTSIRPSRPIWPAPPRSAATATPLGAEGQNGEEAAILIGDGLAGAGRDRISRMLSGARLVTSESPLVRMVASFLGDIGDLRRPLPLHRRFHQPYAIGIVHIFRNSAPAVGRAVVHIEQAVLVDRHHFRVGCGLRA